MECGLIRNRVPWCCLSVRDHEATPSTRTSTMTSRYLKVGCSATDRMCFAAGVQAGCRSQQTLGCPPTMLMQWCSPAFGCFFGVMDTQLLTKWHRNIRNEKCCLLSSATCARELLRATTLLGSAGIDKSTLTAHEVLITHGPGLHNAVFVADRCDL